MQFTLWQEGHNRWASLVTEMFPFSLSLSLLFSRYCSHVDFKGGGRQMPLQARTFIRSIIASYRGGNTTLYLGGCLKN